tara:strand:+ start:142 stop:513 length:372 start_codon:yes stop_codon:yes gene_type:complete
MNPKDAIGMNKVNMFLVPPSAKMSIAEGLKDGAVKYGPWNWRDQPIQLSEYIAAMYRHMDAWVDGETYARDSGKHHLSHAIATLAIIIDASQAGTLIDDRPAVGSFTADRQLVIEENNKCRSK